MQKWQDKKTEDEIIHRWTGKYENGIQFQFEYKLNSENEIERFEYSETNSEHYFVKYHQGAKSHDDGVWNGGYFTREWTKMPAEGINWPDENVVQKETSSPFDILPPEFFKHMHKVKIGNWVNWV